MRPVIDSDSWDSTDACPPTFSVEPEGPLWPCARSAAPVTRHFVRGDSDTVRPDPEALRQLQEAWRHAVQ